MSPGRNVTFLLIIMFMSGSFKNGIEGSIFQKKRVFVTIENDLTTNLTLGCHSSEDNLGTQHLQTNQTFGFNFRPNFSSSTKFVCYFSWLYNNMKVNHTNVLIYKYKRDTTRCDTRCLWGINQTAATQYDSNYIIRLVLPF